MNNSPLSFSTDKVLILDDTRLMRFALMNVLKKLQFKDIKDTYSVKQAKSWLENWNNNPQMNAPLMAPSASDKQWKGPDLIFLDINLTGSSKTEQKSGLDVLQDIRAMEGGDIPFIVIASAADPQEVASKSFELGANSYLPKPFNGNNILEVMKGYRDQR
ncbi:MAG: response regulator [Gammaproteobacteria bacterium]|jgi:CheY-like chemotaxis protein|nr:response regulator [Gammaproteobacteria bacterium]MBT4605669.1 response regulator [Thiotrichales bacterium]MBT3968476.1 response regulator [Gammaproteobacteria bacterium]MBT4079976.1 response regulator [Gammaproteobacteria bacterium]MBT4328336.1 response regulator [Gammaproteobacteria bacterium]